MTAYEDVENSFNMINYTNQVSTAFLQNAGIEVMDRPAKSSDLSWLS